MRVFAFLVTVIALNFCTACGTTDSSMLESGRSETYVQGFHDGRHSGMREAGNNFEHYIRDEARFKADSDYRAGWLAGEAEGKELQDQATAIGRAAAGSYGAIESDKDGDGSTDYDQIAKDAVEGVDTSGLEALEKD